ncbi:Radical SAM domain protein [Magnetococcus marinus MC-1]|uniref:Radical SAM domain protein n=1 Tax=Magnetococcus marinus (strain ATCC BAA-1437 / JCM 17883 / MC-1) TaxID=156889 RepID=A0L7M9_MAGMM|nr:radical SAM protein [Magnetococcus marinus]ABK43972.1 Radical SAM domain protein [Magnetococcus marinus MC-1]
MDMLLVNPKHGGGHEGIFPWGVLSVGSYLKQAGYDVQIIDASIHGIEATLQQIEQHLHGGLNLIGLASMSLDAPFIKRATDRIKTLAPHCTVVVGGPHAALCPESTVRYKHIDYVVPNEGEITAQRLIEALRHAGRIDPAQIPGLAWIDEQDHYRCNPTEYVGFYDIDYELLDPKVKATYGQEVQVLSGRGCSFKCTFCYNVVSGQKWKGRSAKDILDEIQRIIERYQTRRIFFRDELFFHSKGRVLEFLDLYTSRNCNFEWIASVRATDFRDTFVDEALMSRMEQCGCRFLRIGAESGSDEILKDIKKGIKVENVRRTTEIIAKHPKVKLLAGFMIGLPTEQRKDYYATLDLIAWMSRQGENIQAKGPYAYRIYPGGELFDEIVHENPQFALPVNFEGWVERYDVKRGISAGEYDKDAPQPWLRDQDRFLVQNAFRLRQLAFEKLDPQITGLRRLLLLGLILLFRLRFRLGWYRALWDLQLAEWIYRFDFNHLLTNSSLFRGLERLPLYHQFKRTALFGWLKRQRHA